MEGLGVNELMGMEKEALVAIITHLNQEIAKQNDDFKKVINLRLYHLERSQFMHLQYNRRESFEVSGIPENIPTDHLEDEILDICKEAKVAVNHQPLKKADIVACHRIGKKGDVICRVLNRKFAREAVINGKKHLKNTKRYGERKIYVNNSFCHEFRFLNFVCRKSNRDGKINRYKVKNGVNYVQIDEFSKFVQIGHTTDLENLGIDIPERKEDRDPNN